MKEQFTQDDLFRFFRGEFSENEAVELDRWLTENDGNRETYRNAHKVFDAMLMDRIGAEAPAGKVRNGRRIFRFAVAVIANAAALAGIFFIARYFAKEDVRDRLASTLTTISVPDGQRLDITLDDGTRVKMNAGAVLKYPSMFRDDSREVSLSGEAFFEVKHDSERPFTVHTFASDIKVLGTRFNVNANEEQNQFSTALVEGSVKVTNASNAEEYIIMKPSDMVSLENGHLIYKGHYSHSDISWMEGIVVLDGIDFDKMVRKLEKAYGVDIVIDGDAIPSMDHITGELRISDGIDHAMKVLQHIAAFDYSRDPHTGMIHIRQLRK